MLDNLYNKLPVNICEQYLLRLLNTGDNKDIFEMYSNEKIAKYVSRKTHSSIADSDEFIKTINERMQCGNDLYLGICFNFPQKLIGIIRIMEKDEPGTLTIGYALNESCWGRGIMADAIAKLTKLIKAEGYSKLEATVRPDNKNSIRCLEKLGFELSGTFVKKEIVDSKEIGTERMFYVKVLR